MTTFLGRSPSSSFFFQNHAAIVYLSYATRCIRALESAALFNAGAPTWPPHSPTMRGPRHGPRTPLQCEGPDMAPALPQAADSPRGSVGRSEGRFQGGDEV